MPFVKRTATTEEVKEYGTKKFSELPTSEKSPFEQGLKFSISDVQIEFQGVKSRLAFVFVTEVGNLSISTLMNGKINTKGEYELPDGTFNTAFRNAYNEIKKNDGVVLEELKKFIEPYKNKKIEVVRKPCKGIYDGKEYYTTYPIFNIVD